MGKHRGASRRSRTPMELFDFIRYIAALIFVLGLIGGLAWASRYFKLAEKWANLSTSNRRLMVIESLALDPRRRLMIIRRDNIEHLIVLGPSGETVVETGFEPEGDRTTLPTAIESLRDIRSDSGAAILPRLKGDAA